MAEAEQGFLRPPVARKSGRPNTAPAAAEKPADSVVGATETVGGSGRAPAQQQQQPQEDPKAAPSDQRTRHRRPTINMQGSFPLQHSNSRHPSLYDSAASSGQQDETIASAPASRPDSPKGIPCLKKGEDYHDFLPPQSCKEDQHSTELPAPQFLFGRPPCQTAQGSRIGSRKSSSTHIPTLTRFASRNNSSSNSNSNLNVASGASSGANGSQTPNGHTTSRSSSNSKNGAGPISDLRRFLAQHMHSDHNAPQGMTPNDASKDNNSGGGGGDSDGSAPPSPATEPSSNAVTPVRSRSRHIRDHLHLPARFTRDHSGKSSPPMDLGEDHQNLRKKYGKWGKVLGTGAGGTVRLVSRGPHDPVYAVKEFRQKRSTESEKDYMKKVTAEFCIGRTLRRASLPLLPLGGHSSVRVGVCVCVC